MNFQAQKSLKTRRAPFTAAEWEERKQYRPAGSSPKPWIHFRRVVAGTFELQIVLVAIKS